MKSKGQGIKGQVTWIEGNQMPMISEEGEAAPERKTGEPIQRKIIIYPLTKISDTKMENSLFTAVDGKPIAEVESDEEGNFEVELAPGQYSVFTQEEDGLFANSFDLNGNIQPIQVEKGNWSELNILVNYKAAY
ncbi:carboxypeptidase regulatory-like domain-containing protein [Algoriphagus hitonicola]|nr:carboxypeptidase regulatory-like domain-containing protein [Algoriphagus hitonicola]